MAITRRAFVGAAAALGLPHQLSPTSRIATSTATGVQDRFDPWLEIDVDALRHNVRQVTTLTNGRRILAVVKNNAYGLGLTVVPPLLETMPAIAGFAVVKAEAAIALRDAGIRKPILLMGMFPEELGRELVSRDIQLSLYTDDAAHRISSIASAVQRPVSSHLYLDTGMGRMGMPYHRAGAWMESLAANDQIDIAGCYMAFAEEPEFDREQLDRFQRVTDQVRRRGVALGDLHAASSNGVYHLPDAHLDMVRPGIALYGAYPSRPEDEQAKAVLHPAFQLKARVVRVAQLRVGDSVSYGRNYVAERPTWVATLPAGHSDGYPRQAVNGGRVLLKDRLYPVIGAVSASHTIVEVGDEPSVQVGDVATLVGPDRPEIHPNALATALGVSVYDVLMHLHAEMPKIVKNG
jgi:alanine racemase